jgi:P-type Ca2+ transporter type 2C
MIIPTPNSPSSQSVTAKLSDLSSFGGLSEQEATALLKQNGYNEIPGSQRQSLLALVMSTISEPIFLLLVGCGTIYFLLGDAQEAAILLGFVLFIVALTLYQERKTEKSLDALRDLSSPRALVIRDNQKRRIAGREVVVGDVIVLAEGDRVPADAQVLWSNQLSVDESLLTGEAVPVTKTVKSGGSGEDVCLMVHSGTLVVQGQGIALVKATGVHTEMGKIGHILQTLVPEDTRLQQETRSLVGKLTIVAIAICVAVVLVYGLTHQDWLNGLLAGLSLAMAILPNEFPVVLTIFLSMGAWRFSKIQVLTRRMPVVETLGAVTVLCVDKTGTLTFNRMAVQQLMVREDLYDASTHGEAPLAETFHSLVEIGILASRKDPFDPMEKALQKLGTDRLGGSEHLHSDWELLREYPLSGELLAMSCVWRSPQGKQYVVASKGAPEAIADLCHFNRSQIDVMAQQVEAMAQKGLRVLGVARAYFQPVALPEIQHDFDFEFLGLIGLADPLRPSVPEAVAECRSAGIRVVMISGDYPATALQIARQAGLNTELGVLTGSQLAKMDESQLLEQIKGIDVFARMVPEQKLRLVDTLKKSGEIVAMTGDGVNDAPALKSAHIGIAMGERGTDVAREAADLVLLDDDFSSIVRAIRLGRRVHDNLKKAMVYTLAAHVPIAGLTLISVVFGWPLILLPVHIAFLHLIIDPACSVVFEAEPEESDIMNRPPILANEPLFDRATLGIALSQGASVLGVLLLLFAAAYYLGAGEFDARALTFSGLIVANLGMILVNRSWTRTVFETIRSPNSALWWVISLALIFLAAVLYIPALQTLFRFSVLHPNDLLLSLAAGLAGVLWFELLKLWNRRRIATQNA